MLPNVLLIKYYYKPNSLDFLQGVTIIFLELTVFLIKRQWKFSMIL